MFLELPRLIPLNFSLYTPCIKPNKKIRTLKKALLHNPEVLRVLLEH